MFRAHIPKRLVPLPRLLDRRDSEPNPGSLPRNPLFPLSTVSSLFINHLVPLSSPSLSRVCVINTQCCLAAHAEGGQKHGLLRHARASTASRARTRGRRKCAASAPTHLTQWLVSVDTGPGEHIAQIRGAQGFVRPCTRAGAQAGARKRPELLRVVDPAPTPTVLEELSAGYGVSAARRRSFF